jgi:hypothetical protein
VSTPCATRDPEIWFPMKGDTAGYAVAKALCRDCPLRLPCLAVALRDEGTKAAGGRAGVFGGLDEGQRARLSRKFKASELADVDDMRLRLKVWLTA